MRRTGLGRGCGRCPRFTAHHSPVHCVLGWAALFTALPNRYQPWSGTSASSSCWIRVGCRVQGAGCRRGRVCRVVLKQGVLSPLTSYSGPSRSPPQHAPSRRIQAKGGRRRIAIGGWCQTGSIVRLPHFFSSRHPLYASESRAHAPRPLSG